MYSLQIIYLDNENLAGNGNTCWQKCIERIFDDIVGSHANTVSRNIQLCLSLIFFKQQNILAVKTNKNLSLVTFKFCPKRE